LQDITGLKYYAAWVKQHKQVPMEQEVISPILAMQNADSLPLLIELLRMSYEDNLQQDDFERLDQAILGTLRNIALSSATNYVAVNKAIEDYIHQHASIQNINYLYIFLENLEQQFYLNKGTRLNIREVVKQLDSFFNR